MENSHPVIGIVFSKDRAMQLEAALRSFFLNCRDSHLISLNVIYTGSSDIFLSQYGELKQSYPLVNFVRQENFRWDVFRIMGIPVSPWRRFLFQRASRKPFPERYVLFLVDDNIFIRPFSIKDVLNVLETEPDALGFALQLGTNLTYCYPLDIPLEFPQHSKLMGEIIKYNWVNAGSGLNYPLEVSSSIYRIDEIARLVAGLDFSNPNLLEGHLAQKVNDYRVSHPYLLCYKHSVTFCNPVNKVQMVYDNKAGIRSEHSAEHLAGLFDEGYQIDIGSLQGFTPMACHQEVEIQFEKPVTL